MVMRILCAVFNCTQHISVKYNFVITVLCCAFWYCCTVIGHLSGILLITLLSNFTCYFPDLNDVLLYSAQL